MNVGPNGLDGKTILCVMPSFFGYEKRIVAHLESRGARVTYMDERPGNSTVVKTWIRLRLPLAQTIINRYYFKQIAELGKRQFDYILIVSPECCRHELVKKMREVFATSKFILYMWDSFENKMNCKVTDYINLFDRVLTFDDEDAKRYGVICRPLFCSSTNLGRAPESHEFAFSFVGTIHTDRYRVIRTLIEEAARSGLDYYVYMYLPSKIHFWLYRFTKSEFKGTKIDQFKYKPLRYEDVLNVFNRSAAVLDIEHPGQRGLTMRTMEVIGAGKKLITTNSRVKNYSFYSKERVFVFDRRTNAIDLTSINKQPRPLSSAILHQCGIASWADTLFDVS